MIVSQSTAIGRGRPRSAGQGTARQLVTAPQNLQSVMDSGQRTAQPVSAVPSTPRQSEKANYETSFQPNKFVNQPPTTVTERQVVQQTINSRRFQLEYGIQSIDPSGVDRVILWLTTNGGKSWSAHSTDPDNVSPFPVEVPQEGTYGYRIVVHSKDGLTGKTPSSGDLPDMLITVDTTRPDVTITSAPYGRGPSAGKMLINWKAYDDALISRPIRLMYSPRKEGPWTTIAKGLRNTGNYIWKVEPQVPSQVFLRIEATDQAGNTGHHELPHLLDLSGLDTTRSNLRRPSQWQIGFAIQSDRHNARLHQRTRPLATNRSQEPVFRPLAMQHSWKCRRRSNNVHPI